MALVAYGEALSELPRRTTFNPNGHGGTIERHFQGLADNINNTTDSLRAEGYTCIVTQNGPLWDLLATIPFSDSIEAEWNIFGEPQIQHIFDVDDPLINQLSTQTKDGIEMKLRNPTAMFSPAVEAPNIPEKILMTHQIIDMRQAGIDGKEIFTPIYKRQITVAYNSIITWTISNVGAVFSKAQFINYYGIPSNFWPLLPESGDVTNDNVSFNSFNGYLEQYPTYQTVSERAKVQISQTWVFNKWALPLYHNNLIQ